MKSNIFDNDQDGNQNFFDESVYWDVPPSPNTTSLGYNIDSDNSLISVITPGTEDLYDDPEIDPLADNGGTLYTHALPLTSPALDYSTDCTDAGGTPVTTDERLISRPIDGDENGSAVCDSGAYEYNPEQSVPYCGDGNLDDGEECDDGNNQDGDGCSATCEFEEGIFHNCNEHLDFTFDYNFGDPSWWDSGNAPPEDIDCIWEQTQGTQTILFDPEAETITAGTDSSYPLSISTSIEFENTPTNRNETYGTRAVCGTWISPEETFLASEKIDCCEDSIIPFLPKTGELPSTYNLDLSTRYWVMLGINLILLGFSSKILIDYFKK
ncbi:MAG: myxococcus cysteine-rich repeat containing protein [Candidatus Dojkabacteria bacterium]|nr:myxococcus cysteine-rich repeat containing protein [Candidatus Dojkabacteria bacterium]